MRVGLCSEPLFIVMAMPGSAEPWNSLGRTEEPKSVQRPAPVARFGKRETSTSQESSSREESCWWVPRKAKMLASQCTTHSQRGFLEAFAAPHKAFLSGFTIFLLAIISNVA